MTADRVERRYRLLEQWAEEVLESAGIPLDPQFRVREVGWSDDRDPPPHLLDQGWRSGPQCLWRELPEGVAEDDLPGGSKATPLQEILLRGFPSDSDERFAAALIALLRAYRSARQSGDVDVASDLAAELGELHGRWNWIRAARKGNKYGIEQSERGRKGACSRWSARPDIGPIIEKLAQEEDALGDPVEPGELWPELFSELEEKGLEPGDRGDHYTYADSEKITYEAFRKRIQRART